MNDAQGLQLADSLNLLLNKKTIAEIGLGFDQVAEQLRNNKIKIYVFEKYFRQFDLELYFALERKNKASFVKDTIETDRLKKRIQQLITEKKIQEDKNMNMVDGHFHYQGGIIQGTLCRLVKNEGILLQLLHAYDLRI